MTSKESKGAVAVIGSGIVGICTAIELQRVGYQVTLFDKAEPARETTYGNASFIAVELSEPQATPANILSEIKLLFSVNTSTPALRSRSTARRTRAI